MKVPMKELNKMAENSEALKDTVVYRGFVDKDLDTNVTYDFGETPVMLTPIGEFVGSTPDGKPTKEIVDEESVKAMASQLEEILLDRDHASMRKGSEKDSSAMGWISGLKAITGLGDMSGLYGVIKWSSEGIKLVHDRIYRFLSPVFELDENGRAIKLVNVAMTNMPALKMPPIINSEAAKTEVSITKNEESEMTKEEIQAMVKDMIVEALQDKTAINSEAPAISTEPVMNEAPAEEKKEEEKKEEVQNSCEETKEEVKNEEPEKKEEEEKVENTEAAKCEKCGNDPCTCNSEENKEEEKTEEVIKPEVLNSISDVKAGTSVNDTDKWRSLHGQAFWDYLKNHKA